MQTVVPVKSLPENSLKSSFFGKLFQIKVTPYLRVFCIFQVQRTIIGTLFGKKEKTKSLLTVAEFSLADIVKAINLYFRLTGHPSWETLALQGNCLYMNKCFGWKVHVFSKEYQVGKILGFFSFLLRNWKIHFS